MTPDEEHARLGTVTGFDSLEAMDAWTAQLVPAFLAMRFGGVLCKACAKRESGDLAYYEADRGTACAGCGKRLE